MYMPFYNSLTSFNRGMSLQKNKNRIEMHEIRYYSSHIHYGRKTDIYLKRCDRYLYKETRNSNIWYMNK